MGGQLKRAHTVLTRRLCDGVRGWGHIMNDIIPLTTSLRALCLVTSLAACQPERVVTVGKPPVDPGCTTDLDCPDDGICVFGECADPATFECRDDTVPLVGISPLAVEFGNVGLGNTAEAHVTISNLGSCLLTLRGVGLADDSSPGFSCSPCNFTSYPMRVAPSRSQDITVHYSPATLGEHFGTLSIATDDLTAGDNGLVNVDLHGAYSGLPVLVLEPSELNFGYLPYSAGVGGESRTESVRMTNRGSGNALLTVQFIYLTPPDSDFSIPEQFAAVSPADPILLPPYDPDDASTWVDIPVTLAPSRNADHQASLVVRAYGTDAADAADVSVRLAGSSLGPPKIDVAPLQVDFKTEAGLPLPLGTVGFRQVSVSNSGQSELTLDLGLDDTSGEFSFAPTHVAPLPPGGAAVISLFYTPLTPSDPSHPDAPTSSRDAYFRIVSNDVDAVLTTVGLHGWAKSSLADDYLRLEMEFDNDEDSWAQSDFRNVDLELVSPLGFSCKKPEYSYSPAAGGGYVVSATYDFCGEWTATGLEGQTAWIPGGAYEEPERILLFGLGPDKANGGTFEVRANYMEDCDNIPSGLLADLLGIGTSTLLGVLGNAIGVPLYVRPSDVSDLIEQNCWDHASTVVTVHIFVNGTEVAAPQQRLLKKGDSVTMARVKRQSGTFEVVP